MEVNKKVPEIRFSGFDVEWEEKRFFQVVNYRNGKAHENCIDPKGRYVVVNSKFVSTSGKVRKFSDLQIEPLFKDELAFVLSDVPNGKAIARTFYIEKDNFYTLNQRIAALTPINGSNVHFLNRIINRNKYFLKFDDGVKQTNLSKMDIEAFLGNYPSPEEQSKIGNFFKELDELIHLQEQKHEKLLNLKKAMLDKMFPKEGAAVPEIRFKGFTDKWEKKKLGEIAQIISGGTPSTSVKEYWNGDIDWFSPTEIGKSTYADSSVKKITFSGLENSSAKMLPAFKTILFTSRAGIGDMAILRVDATTNQGFQSLVVNNEYDIYFVYSMGHLIKSQAIQKASGSTFLEISGKILARLKFQVPSLKEQEKIGGYFENLDKLIAQSQQQINKYKNIKQALLQKMFV